MTSFTLVSSVTSWKTQGLLRIKITAELHAIPRPSGCQLMSLSPVISVLRGSVWWKWHHSDLTTPEATLFSKPLDPRWWYSVERWSHVVIDSGDVGRHRVWRSGSLRCPCAPSPVRKKEKAPSGGRPLPQPTFWAVREIPLALSSVSFICSGKGKKSKAPLALFLPTQILWWLEVVPFDSGKNISLLTLPLYMC